MLGPIAYIKAEKWMKSARKVSSFINSRMIESSDRHENERVVVISHFVHGMHYEEYINSIMLQDNWYALNVLMSEYEMMSAKMKSYVSQAYEELMEAHKRLIPKREDNSASEQLSEIYPSGRPVYNEKSMNIKFGSFFSSSSGFGSSSYSRKEQRSDDNNSWIFDGRPRCLKLSRCFYPKIKNC